MNTDQNFRAAPIGPRVIGPLHTLCKISMVHCKTQLKIDCSV